MPSPVSRSKATIPTRKAYPSDLTDEEFEILATVFPVLQKTPFGENPTYTLREILNAIRYKARTGAQWRNLPHDFPPWQTVSGYFYRWAKLGYFQRAREQGVLLVRRQEGRSDTPTAGSVDAQSVKTDALTPDRGFDAGKKIKGRKRHIFVDILGMILVSIVTVASVQDRDGGALLLRTAHAMYESLELAWVDSAYNCEVVHTASKDTGIRVEVSSRPEGQKGFVVEPKRWVVERTFGWINWWRELSKEHTKKEAYSQAWLDVCMMGICTRRLGGVSCKFHPG